MIRRHVARRIQEQKEMEAKGTIILSLDLSVKLFPQPSSRKEEDC